MTEDLRRLKFVRSADVYKAGQLAGHLDRTARGSVAFSYTSNYLDSRGCPVSTTLPLAVEPVEAPSGALPSFFQDSCPKGTGSLCSRML